MPAAEQRPRRVALVTGGARRIGRAIVERLAADGWGVVIACHRSADEISRDLDILAETRLHAALGSRDLAHARTRSRSHVSMLQRLIGIIESVHGGLDTIDRGGADRRISHG